MTQKPIRTATAFNPSEGKKDSKEPKLLTRINLSVPPDIMIAIEKEASLRGIAKTAFVREAIDDKLNKAEQYSKITETNINEKFSKLSDELFIIRQLILGLTKKVEEQHLENTNL